MSKDYVNPGAPAYVVAGAAGVRMLALISLSLSLLNLDISLTNADVCNTVHRRAGPVAVGAHAPVDRRPLQ
jgi:hypothetical protein